MGHQEKIDLTTYSLIFMKLNIVLHKTSKMMNPVIIKFVVIYRAKIRR